MAKKKKTKRRNRQLRWMLCDWCAAQSQTTRADTKTCSARCRQRMATFIRETGYAPECAPGPKTAGDAINLEIIRLFRQEKARREALGTLRSV